MSISAELLQSPRTVRGVYFLCQYGWRFGLVTRISARNPYVGYVANLDALIDVLARRHVVWELFLASSCDRRADFLREMTNQRVYVQSRTDSSEGWLIRFETCLRGTDLTSTKLLQHDARLLGVSLEQVLPGELAC